MTEPATFDFAALAAVAIVAALAYRRWGALGAGAWLLGQWVRL